VFEGFPGAESTGKGRPERVLDDREHGCSALNDGSFGGEGFANIPGPHVCSSSVPFGGCCHTCTINGDTEPPFHVSFRVGKLSPCIGPLKKVTGVKRAKASFELSTAKPTVRMGWLMGLSVYLLEDSASSIHSRDGYDLGIRIGLFTPTSHHRFTYNIKYTHLPGITSATCACMRVVLQCMFSSCFPDLETQIKDNRESSFPNRLPTN